MGMLRDVGDVLNIRFSDAVKDECLLTMHCLVTMQCVETMQCVVTMQTIVITLCSDI